MYHMSHGRKMHGGEMLIALAITGAFLLGLKCLTDYIEMRASEDRARWHQRCKRGGGWSGADASTGTGE